MEHESTHGAAVEGGMGAGDSGVGIGTGRRPFHGIPRRPNESRFL